MICIMFNYGALGKDKFVESAEIVATVPAENKRKPSYFHSFAMTENYFILLELPLVFNVWSLISSKLRGKPINKALQWVKGEMVRYSGNKYGI